MARGVSPGRDERKLSGEQAELSATRAPLCEARARESIAHSNPSATCTVIETETSCGLPDKGKTFDLDETTCALCLGHMNTSSRHMRKDPDRVCRMNVLTAADRKD